MRRFKERGNPQFRFGEWISKLVSKRKCTFGSIPERGTPSTSVDSSALHGESGNVNPSDFIAAGGKES
jgi:hypothetical protein